MLPRVNPSNDTTVTVSERAILDGVGARNFERARLYLAWGAVFETRREGPWLRARCEGSTEETYAVRARLDGDGVAEASCSCPVGEGGGCKHTGAMLLRWREAPGDFLPLTPLDEALGALEADALRSLVRAMLQRRGELDAVLDDTLPGRRPTVDPPADAWRERAATVFRRADRVDTAVAGLDALLREGEASVRRGDALHRGALYLQVAHATLGRWRRYGPASAAVLAVTRRCLDALAGCVDDARGDDRAALLRALVGFVRFDIDQGSALGYGPSPGRHAVTLVTSKATLDERRALADDARDEVERADGFAQRAWTLCLLRLEEGVIDDATWVARARALDRHGAVARHLAARGAFEASLAELARVHDAELVEVADALASQGDGAEVERRVVARMERASEANRARMTAWLKARAEARRDAEAMTDALEAELRARPSVEAYDALQAKAGPRWAEVEPRVLAWLEERNHALVYEVLLREGRIDEALRVALSERQRPTHAVALRRRLAEALEAARPRDALAVYRGVVDGLVALRSRAHYREACQVVARARTLTARLGDDAGGAAWVEALRARYAGLPAFQQELDAA
jgi:hypothetical protein